MLVRQAILDDVAAITELYCSHVVQWEAQDGSPADYAALSLYEKWLHGGPWMARETCAVWVGHLLQATDGIPLVVEQQGSVLGYAEVFLWEEPAPYNLHLNISTLCVAQQAQRQGIGRALLDYIQQMAQVVQARQLTVAYPHEVAFYERLGFAPQVARYMVSLPAQQGRVFYQAKALQDDSPGQVRAWHMPLGRFQSAREEWERMRWHLWNAVPGLVEAEWQRLHIQLTGQPAILHLQAHREDAGRVTARLWTKNPMTTHMMSAVMDRVARLGYERISTLIDSSLQPMLGEAPDAVEAQWLYAKSLEST